MPLDFPRESLAASSDRDRNLDFLETELSRRDEEIASLRISHETLQKKFSHTKMELSGAKSYINSLPTLEEVGRLKNALSGLNDEKQQLIQDLLSIKELNLELNSKISALSKKNHENECALRNKEAEVDALQFTVKLWENRRRAARQAGNVTVEDIVADKMKLEEHFHDMVKIAECREQFFKAKIDKMKLERGDHKHMLDSQKEVCTALRATIERITAKSEEVHVENKMLKDVRKDLEKKVAVSDVEIGQLEAIEAIRKKTDIYIRFCLVEMSKCHKAARRIMVFIENAIGKKFLDPSLLFSGCEDSAEPGSKDYENLNECAKNWLSEIEILSKQIKDCQKMITDMYVSRLSTLGDSQCQIQ